MADDGTQSPQSYTKGATAGGRITSPMFTPPASARRPPCGEHVRDFVHYVMSNGERQSWCSACNHRIDQQGAA